MIHSTSRHRRERELRLKKRREQEAIRFQEFVTTLASEYAMTEPAAKEFISKVRLYDNPPKKEEDVPWVFTVILLGIALAVVYGVVNFISWLATGK